MTYSNEAYKKAINALVALKANCQEKERGTIDFIIEALREKAKNDKLREAGRLVVLPNEPIAARYDIADMLQDFKKEAEFYDHSVGINGITWAESDLLAAIIDALNLGREEAEKALEGLDNGLD